MTNANDDQTSTARAAPAEPKAAAAAGARGEERVEAGGDVKLVSPASVAATPSMVPAGQKLGKRGTTYKLVESGEFEIADHTSDRMRSVSVPEKLIATVTLPPDAVSLVSLRVWEGTWRGFL